MTSLSDLKLRTVSLVSIATSYCDTHQGLSRFNLLLYRAVWFGNWNTIFKRFRHWVKRDVLKHIFDAVSKDPDMQYAMVDDISAKIHKRRTEAYDRALCLIPRDVLDFVLATQPQAWERLAQHHGALVEEQFLKRLASEIARRGALDVLRNGIRDMGCRFRLAWFHPGCRSAIFVTRHAFR